jgi:hypothetical protein
VGLYKVKSEPFGKMDEQCGSEQKPTGPAAASVSAPNCSMAIDKSVLPGMRPPLKCIAFCRAEGCLSSPFRHFPHTKVLAAELGAVMRHPVVVFATSRVFASYCF